MTQRGIALGTRKTNCIFQLAFLIRARRTVLHGVATTRDGGPIESTKEVIFRAVLKVRPVSQRGIACRVAEASGTGKDAFLVGAGGTMLGCFAVLGDFAPVVSAEVIV